MSKNNQSHLNFSLFYDFRNPAAWRRPYADIYSEIFEQIRWAEKHSFDNVWLSEHHLVDDGYAPSVLPIAAAIAAQTKTIRIGSAVIILPLHNPIRVAEDERPPRHHPVDVAPPFDVLEVRTLPARDEERVVAADGTPGAHRRVDTAGDEAPRTGEELRARA